MSIEKVCSVSVIRVELERWERLDTDEATATFEGPEALRDAEKRLQIWGRTAPPQGGGYDKCGVKITVPELRDGSAPGSLTTLSLRFDLQKGVFELSKNVRAMLACVVANRHGLQSPEAREEALRLLVALDTAGFCESRAVVREAVIEKVAMLAPERGLEGVLRDAGLLPKGSSGLSAIGVTQALGETQEQARERRERNNDAELLKLSGGDLAKEVELLYDGPPSAEGLRFSAGAYGTPYGVRRPLKWGAWLVYETEQSTYTVWFGGGRNEARNLASGTDLVETLRKAVQDPELRGFAAHCIRTFGGEG